MDVANIETAVALLGKLAQFMKDSLLFPARPCRRSRSRVPPNYVQLEEPEQGSMLRGWKGKIGIPTIKEPGAWTGP